MHMWICMGTNSASEVQCACLNTRVRPPFDTAKLLRAQYQPVLDGGAGVLAAAHSDHDDGEEEEEAGHGEAHTVHRLVAHDDIAIHLARVVVGAHAETWNLTKGWDGWRTGGDKSGSDETLLRAEMSEKMKFSQDWKIST